MRWSTQILRASVVVAAIAALFIGVYCAIPSLSQAKDEMKAMFTSDGELIQPEGYREWMHVGTPLTPNDLNPPEAAFPEFHNVYIDPDSYAHYKKTGKFPEGTTLIKELVSVGSKAAASGKGYFMGEFVGLEASVKSAKRFPKEPGNWGYFTFSHEPPPYPAKAKLQPTETCNSCHEGAAKEDWVFTQYYPVLRAAKGK
jgi:hypothetical protein